MARMYTDEMLMSVYNKLKGIVIAEDPEFKKLIDKIESETDYLTAPASTKYHGCYERGLLEHLVSCAMEILKIKKALAPDISDAQCIKVALLHDVGKCGEPGNPFYLVNRDYNPNKNLTNFNAPYVYNEEITSMPHAHRSVWLIQNMGYKLTPDEFQAIIAHDGQYVDDNIAYKMKECKLGMLLHFADVWTSLYKES